MIVPQNSVNVRTMFVTWCCQCSQYVYSRVAKKKKNIPHSALQFVHFCAGLNVSVKIRCGLIQDQPPPTHPPTPHTQNQLYSNLCFDHSGSITVEMSIL